jgi:hypothetical protein
MKGRRMTNIKSDNVTMLEILIVEATQGKKISLEAKPVREVVQLERDGQYVNTVILSIEYSGTIEDKPFTFRKDYSFADDAPEDALECLLIANNRLQVDYERLKEVGIEIDAEFFNFQNCSIGLPGDVSLARQAYRLEDFIQLARAGIPVSVDVSLKRPVIVVDQGGVKKKGFGYIATFDFTVRTSKTSVEKLYGLGSYDDAKGDETPDIVEVANRRLDRDSERLRSAGMRVDKLSFFHIWEKVYDR